MRQLLFNRLNSLAARCSDHFPKLGIALRSWLALRSGEPELRWVPHLVRKGDVALDIGANWGPYAHQLSRAGCRVIAFEPNQDMARRLAHALPNAQVEAVALSDREGTATLHIPVMQNGEGATGFGSMEAPRAGGGGESLELQILVKRLDDYAYERVNFIKIDVEGHEAATIEGSIETITRCKPNILVELWNGPSELYDKMAEIGYTPFAIRNDIMTEVDKCDKNENCNYFFIHKENRKLIENLLKAAA